LLEVHGPVSESNQADFACVGKRIKNVRRREDSANADVSAPGRQAASVATKALI
jgi:hypothetical protein